MKNVAIFDFDHTLIMGDSLWPFLMNVAGGISCYAALAEAVAILALQHARGQTDGDDRTVVKAQMLRRLLKDRKRERLVDAAVRTRAWQKENAPLMRRLREHREQGDTIVIASGGLDLYLPELLRDVPHDALICTQIGVADGIVTGEMINGNCVRMRKAELVGEWLAVNGPFGESFAYGNYPHDVPMMELTKHRIIVS